MTVSFVSTPLLRTKVLPLRSSQAKPSLRWSATRRTLAEACTPSPGVPSRLESSDQSFAPASNTVHFTALDFESRREDSSANEAAETSLFDNDGDRNGSSGLGGGGRSRGGNDGTGDSDDSLPEDMRIAVRGGALSEQDLTRYHASLRNPLTRALLQIPAFRARFLADPAFLFKLLVQELIGNGTALASEIAVRGKDIIHELEYVASDLIVGTVVEAAFVWLLAPTIASPAARSGLQGYLASLPSNMFQQSTAIQSFSPSQRAMSFLYAGAQYAVIGFAAGIVGTAITYGLIETRKRVDKTYQPERPMPAVIPNALAWGAFMALSSNTRFQMVEGIERGIASLFADRRAPSVVNSSIISLRFVNNYWGGVQFVQFFRYLGLHATGEEKE